MIIIVKLLTALTGRALWMDQNKKRRELIALSQRYFFIMDCQEQLS